MYILSESNHSKCIITITVRSAPVAHCRNLKGLVVFGLFDKLRYSFQRKDQLNLRVYPEKQYLEEENGKMIALLISPKIDFLWIG